MEVMSEQFSTGIERSWVFGDRLAWVGCNQNPWQYLVKTASFFVREVFVVGLQFLFLKCAVAALGVGKLASL